eukprot:2707998-Amphidinium_carterae.1
MWREGGKSRMPKLECCMGAAWSSDVELSDLTQLHVQAQTQSLLYKELTLLAVYTSQCWLQLIQGHSRSCLTVHALAL